MIAVASGPSVGLDGRIVPWVGTIMAVHFVEVCAIKAALGIGADVFWISHVALGLAAAGLLLRSALIASAALAIIAMPHLFWLIDGAIGFATGVFPLGLTAYLQHINGWGWAATTHHFYLLPTLYVILIRPGRFAPGVFRASVVLCVLLSLIGRFLLPAGLNVNQAHGMLPRVNHPVVLWANALPTVPYLIVLNAVVSLCMTAPSIFILRRLSRNPAAALETGTSLPSTGASPLVHVAQ